MSKKTTPILVVGSGRCGTRSIAQLLAGISHLESYHEYACTHLQPLAAKYYMGLISKKALKKEIAKLHGAAIYYSKAKYWIDCSNKLSWVIEPFLELFPQAKFVHLIRDGRKVVSSFFHKLGPEIYDNESVKILQDWLKKPKEFPEPPPEKKYWWNIPQRGQPFAQEFPQFSRFQRICYHWVEAIRVISESFKEIPKKQRLVVKLEELTTDREILKEFLSFFDVEYEDHFFEFLQRPRNVFFPMDFKLTKKELTQFQEIAQETMDKLGYTSKEAYEIKY